MRTIHAVPQDDFKNYQTAKIRERFLIDNQVQSDEINCTYTLYDRMIVGFANPVTKKLELPNYPTLRAEYFLERRELGIINVGGEGTIIADGKPFTLKKLDFLYIGK